MTKLIQTSTGLGNNISMKYNLFLHLGGVHVINFSQSDQSFTIRNYSRLSATIPAIRGYSHYSPFATIRSLVFPVTQSRKQ